MADLNGLSFEIGGSAGEAVTIGGALSVFTDPNGNLKSGIALLAGPGVGLLPLKEHPSVANTTVEKLFNRYECWDRFKEEYSAWRL